MIDSIRKNGGVRVAIVGATGAVGLEFLSVLAQRRFPAAEVRCLASVRSAGSRVAFNGSDLVVAELTPDSFDNIDVALFSAGKNVSKTFGPIAADAGAVVIDNSSAFRMDPAIPLVVPEINGDDASPKDRIIANPNCSTILFVMVLGPLRRLAPIRRVVVSTYQAVSGAGMKAMRELEAQSHVVLAGQPAVPNVLPHPCAFNVFSHNSAIGPDGYNEEERKMVLETRKILHDDSLAIDATCIRVPVLRAHSESVNVTFDRPVSANDVRACLSRAAGVRIVDDRDGNRFPMPVEAAGGDDVLVGRIRQDISQPDGRGVSLFLSGDQLRKGAALNAVQITERLLGGGRVESH